MENIEKYKENLISVAFNNCNVSDVSPLAGCKKLNYIYGDNNNVSNVDSLVVLEDLKEICFGKNNITTISEKFKSLRIQAIDFSDNPG